MFENMQKSDSEQMPDDTYAEFLKAQTENCKSLFTDEELQTLNEDIKKIDEIDRKIQGLEGKE